MNQTRTTLREPSLDYAVREQFSEFIAGMVVRINRKTFNAEIERVEVDYDSSGSQATIDRVNKVIRISYSVFESLPRRLSRYWVLHQIAHFANKDHSKEFYFNIERFEPNYKILEQQLNVFLTKNSSDKLPKCDVSENTPQSYQGFSSVDLNSNQHLVEAHLNRLLKIEEDENQSVQPSNKHISKSDIKINTKNGAIVESIG